MPSLRAQIDAHRTHRGMQVGILARLAARCHPVRRQSNVGEVLDVGGDDIGHRLGNRQASRCRCVQKRYRCTFAHGHGFAGVPLVTAQADGDIRNRHLPRTHHLIATDQSAHRAVADRDQKGFVGDRRQTQQPVQRIGNGRTGRRQRCAPLRHAADAPDHARHLAEQHLHGHIDGRGREHRVEHAQAAVVGDLSHHGEGTTFALAQGAKAIDAARNERQYVALLCFVAPNLHRGQLRFGAWNFAQIDPPAATAVRNDFGQRVR